MLAMMTPPTLVIATTNPGKLREVTAMLAGLPLEIRTLADFPPIPAPKEDGPSFEANARLKAQYYAARLGAWVLADDSGLEVAALGGEPGVHSARFAGDQTGDAANNALLIRRLRDVPPDRRSARFRCVMALADPSQVLAVAEGAIEGVIVDEPRGSNGFGYDPHFFVPVFGMTTAQMPPEQKNRVSHRGRALAAIRPKIERLLASPAGPSPEPL
jgi:XTP/dITP diphosphohydrolase